MVAFGRLAVTGRLFLAVLTIYLVYVAISLLLPWEGPPHTQKHLQEDIVAVVKKEEGCEGEGCQNVKVEREENARLKEENAKLVENKPLPVYKGCPMCLTGLGENVAMGMDKCQWVDERQLLEVGNFYPSEDGQGKYTLRPKDTAEWQGRQDRAQIELKRLTKLKVTEALEEIKVDEMMASLEATMPGEKKNRRAVVFYMDQGKSGKQQLNWWLKAWQFSGLDEPSEAFDIVVMAHPSVAPDIANQCTLVTPQFSAKFNGSGKCFYKPYIGIAHRAHVPWGVHLGQQRLPGEQTTPRL